MHASVCCAFALGLYLSVGVSLCGAGDPAALTKEGVRPVYELRQHPSYQVFAARIHLPEIKALDDSVLAVDGQRLDLAKADLGLKSEQLTTVADQLKVPAEVLPALVQKLSATQPLKGEELAHSFRTALIDYGYLSEQWARYRPPPGTEAVKQEAKKALAEGDLDRAWLLFGNLPRPRPPTGLRVAGFASSH
jgi:hypothetical protein